MCRAGGSCRTGLKTTGLDYLTSLYNSSSPIVENEWNCSSGDL